MRPIDPKGDCIRRRRPCADRAGRAQRRDARLGIGQRPGDFAKRGLLVRPENYHNDAIVARGYGDVARRIQELFVAGRKAEAAAVVPDEYIDEKWLIDPRDRIRQRRRPWLDGGITRLSLR